MKVAMISYNTFVEEEQNGWKEKGPNRVLLLQNVKGERWGTSQFGRIRDEWYAETKALIDPLWAELQNELQNLDRVILYVGSHGAERIIELAANAGLTSGRAIFVHCKCNTAKKMEVIRSRGFFSSKVVDCECGGHETMRLIYKDALDRGILPS